MSCTMSPSVVRRSTSMPWRANVRSMWFRRCSTSAAEALAGSLRSLRLDVNLLARLGVLAAQAGRCPGSPPRAGRAARPRPPRAAGTGASGRCSQPAAAMKSETTKTSERRRSVLPARSRIRARSVAPGVRTPVLAHDLMDQPQRLDLAASWRHHLVDVAREQHRADTVAVARQQARDHAGEVDDEVALARLRRPEVDRAARGPAAARP